MMMIREGSILSCSSCGAMVEWWGISQCLEVCSASKQPFIHDGSRSLALVEI